MTRVGKVFTDAPERTVALEEFDLSVADGEFVALVGPSGCGKSTLLRLVADLDEPSSGSIRVCGLRPAEARRQREFGIVFQSPVLYAWRDVLANVALPLEIAGLGRAERDARALEAIAQVGLGDVADRYPRQLSGGMQQRVAIARALVTRPRVLLMDEPFGSLDELTRERLNLALLEIWRETGVTVVFVTHAIEEAVFLADRVAVLTPRPGRVAAVVEIEVARPRGPESLASRAHFDAVTRVRTLLRESAAQG
jgi:NitT/TauT family transport system ATP-binding protein